MTKDERLSRRRLLLFSAATGGVALGARVDPAAADSEAAERYKWALRDVTPAVVAGPFYPLRNKPVDASADLTANAGTRGRPRGDLLYVLGRILDIKGKPVRGVKVEIWQANAAGRYSHPSDGNPAALDPHFRGYGFTVTDSEGRYRFTTVKPGAYPVVPGWDRAPHIHFQLTGKVDRHITQMWFPDERLNGQDRLLQAIPSEMRNKVTCRLGPPAGTMEPRSTVALLDLVLTNG